MPCIICDYKTNINSLAICDKCYKETKFTHCDKCGENCIIDNIKLCLLCDFKNCPECDTAQLDDNICSECEFSDRLFNLFVKFIAVSFFSLFIYMVFNK